MSILKVNTLEEATVGGATFFTTKAWVNFNGTGSVSIRADGGVSSITDYGTGNYGVNYSPAMIDASYSITGMGGDGGTGQSSFKVLTSGNFGSNPLQFSTTGTRVGATNADTLNANVMVAR